MRQRLRRGGVLRCAIGAQLGAYDSQRLGMKHKRKMPNVVQRHNPPERYASHHRLDRLLRGISGERQRRERRPAYDAIGG